MEVFSKLTRKRVSISRKEALLALVTVACVGFVPTQASAGSCASPLKIESGDTLSGIAQRCNSSVAALLANNPHVDESGAVRVGDSIYLPAQTSLFNAEQLDELLAPVALHPDVLLAEMLPAATYPLEVVQAARWKERNKNSEVSDQEPWADSVKALTRYPEVLAQMNEDIEWTSQLGEAFLAQPDDVFASIQRLRRLADAAGHLNDNEVQDIVVEPASQGKETIIRIVHADPYYVHVPTYDPRYVYSDRAYNRHNYGGVHFSVGFLLGGWLHHTLDWHHRHLFYQPYHATAYNRYYRYDRYRPYASFNRSARGYSHSPYRGLRWRHNARHYNPRKANPRRYDGDRYRGQGYHARRGAGERRLVNGNLNRQIGSSVRDTRRTDHRSTLAASNNRQQPGRSVDQRETRRNGQRGSQRNSQRNAEATRNGQAAVGRSANSDRRQQQRAAEIKTEVWKAGNLTRNQANRDRDLRAGRRDAQILKRGNSEQRVNRSSRSHLASNSSKRSVAQSTTSQRRAAQARQPQAVRQERSTRQAQTSRRAEPVRRSESRQQTRQRSEPRRAEASRRPQSSSRRASGNSRQQRLQR